MAAAAAGERQAADGGQLEMQKASSLGEQAETRKQKTGASK